MQYKYDPMLCMNVPVSGTRTMDTKVKKTQDGYWTKLASKNGYSLWGKGGFLWHICKGDNLMNEVEEFEQFDMRTNTSSEKIANRKALQYFEKYVSSHKRIGDARTVDAKAMDANIDIKHTAEYLWTWENGSTGRDLFNEALNRWPGEANPENRKEAFKWAQKEATKELDKVYSSLQKEVNTILKDGYNKSKQLINSIK